MRYQKEFEALRERYENGDGLALFEAVYLLPPKPTDNPHLDHCPNWLHWAMVDYVRAMARAESSSKALGLKKGRGIPSASDQWSKRKVEAHVWAMVQGIQQGRKRSGIPYPEGENAYSIAARLFCFLDDGGDEEKIAQRIEKWCALARKRGTKSVGNNDTFRRLTADRIVERKSYPPWDTEK